MTIYLICFFFLIILSIVIWCFFKKINKIEGLQDDEIWNRYYVRHMHQVSHYEDELKEKQEKLNYILDIITEKNKVKNSLDLEISEKQNFNSSLFKIREDELDRLIEEKRKEKEAALKKRLAYEEELKIKEMADELKEFIKGQEEIRTNYLKSIEQLKEELDSFADKRAAINTAILREKELAEKEDFFRIVVPQEDQEDIEVLNTIAPRLRNKEALSRLIYDVFIRRPMDEMIKRVTGAKDVCGIYKITYMKTGEAYIGKTTNIKKRWAEHCKSALGIGTIAHSSFHNRLKKDGIWNYTFEILEEVPKEQLTEREKFYIKLYGTDSQLNMKVG